MPGEALVEPELIEEPEPEVVAPVLDDVPILPPVEEQAASTNTAARGIINFFI